MKKDNKCIDCDQVIYGLKRCQKCNIKFYTGINSFNYKNGKWLKAYCIDCKEPISRGSNRCIKCSGRFQGKQRTGINNTQYKYGKRCQGYENHCIDCGIKIGQRSKRCDACNKYYYSGCNHPMYNKHHTDKAKQQMGKKRMGKNNGMYGKVVPTKYIKYKNIYFHSSWEANFAKWLDLSGIKWQYESRAFDLINTTYTPDFYLPEINKYIEIKGWWRLDAIKKFKKFKKLYPKMKIKVLEKGDLKLLSVL